MVCREKKLAGKMVIGRSLWHTDDSLGDAIALERCHYVNFTSADLMSTIK